jgi:hypothetical protein
MQIVSRTGGRGVVEPYEAAALKDVIYLGRQGKKRNGHLLENVTKK